MARPDVVLGHYWRLATRAGYPVIERRGCSLSPDHVFWVSEYRYCPYDGARLDKLLERKVVKGQAASHR